MPSVIIMGGSVGGLTAALVLRDAGCEVRVFERSSAALQARGAGIAALEATLRYLTERGGRPRADVCSSTNWIRFLRPDGSILHEQRHRYLFSSWNTIYRSLLELFDPGRYLLGREVTGFRQSGDSVRVTLADGTGTITGADADLLVCADGVSSLARARLLPEVRPSYSGYVAWRGTLPEQALPAATRELLGDAITYQVLQDSHILVYPIPGPGGALTAGDRLVNFVWYVNVAAGGELDALMTGRDGVRRAVSLPPGAARDEPLTAMRQGAAARFARPIARGRDRRGRAVRPGRLRHRRPPHGVRPGLPDRRRRVRGPAARGRGHGQGRRRRLGPRRGTRSGRRGRAGRAGELGTQPARPRPRPARPVPRHRRQLAVRWHLPAR